MAHNSQITRKTCLFVNRRSPHGSSHAVEALDMAYALAAFEHRVSLLFMDDGVFQIIRDQQTADIGVKNFSPAFRAWQDYEIEHVFVEKASLQSRGLERDDLLIEVEMIDTKTIGQILQQQAFIFND